MKLRQMTLFFIVLFLWLTAGCASTFRIQEQTEKVLQERDARLSKEYMEKLSILSGRLDGMNKAIVKGLTETLDTARIAREMSEEALAIARENKKVLEGKEQESYKKEESEEEFQFTPMEE
ncbi:MAG: hypothetical protein BA867_12230 [Desulfobacterales bacterium S5133MH16]|nr:MAG: hypothetical protein BA867_12230 [Desulfobacterales bacterium S5133MH16]